MFGVREIHKGCEDMGIVFEGSKEECERFVCLQDELLSLSGGHIEIDFEIMEARHDELWRQINGG